MRQIPREPRAPSTSSSSPNILRTGSRTRPPVFATPVMIMVMENAALNAIRAYLYPGESAVGTAVNVRHLVATPVGRLVSGGRQR
jgi:fluoroacetyl-CoA thioesterase